MKRSRSGQYVFIILAVAALYRLAFDVTTYYYGSSIVVRSESSFDYVLHFPKGYSDFDGKRPLLVFLHGAGETENDSTILKRKDVFYYANGKVAPEEFPFVVVSPSAPNHGWNPDEVNQFIDDFLEDKRFRYKIDESRVYLTGFSMGGSATFEVAAKRPERFAAIVPLAGGCAPEYAEKLQNVPTWAFHGAADSVVSPDSSRQIIEALACRNRFDARLTMIEGAGHNICDAVYSRGELYRWMLSRSTPRSNREVNAP